MKRTTRRARATLVAVAVLVAAAPALAATYIYRHAIPAGPAPAAEPTHCVLPWGGVLKNGQSATAYRTPGVPFGGACEFETRACELGVLGGSFAHSSCAPAAPLSCALPWGGTLQHGQQATAYAAATVPFGSTCQPEERACANGILSGTFTSQACAVEAAAACALPWGGTLDHGQKATAYAASTVPYGETCRSEERACANGTLSGGFASASCTVAAPAACTLPWGGTLAHAGTVTAYKAASVPFGSTCEKETRTCANGTLSGSFSSQACTAAPAASCTTQTKTWGTYCSAQVQGGGHGTSRVVNGSGPNYYSGQATYVCNNGTWVFNRGTCDYSNVGN